MRVFKTKWFVRFARKADISDDKLIDAVREVEAGLNDGDLGGGLIKKRVARAGEGKSGGYRTLIAYSKGKRTVFVYGFPKSAKANISDLELETYKKLAQIYMDISESNIENALKADELKEIDYNGKKISK